MYSSRPKARTAHIGSVRLADENPLLVGAEPGLRYLVPQTKNAADPSSAVKGGKVPQGIRRSRGMPGVQA